MPAFRYEALQADGQSRQGTLDADSLSAARSQLRAQGWVPLQVEPVGAHMAAAGPAAGAGRWAWGPGARVWNGAQRALWTRQMAELVGSGLTVERALAALADDAPDARQRQLLDQVRAQVQAGQALALALGQFPREFPDIDRAVIGAGEQTGQLGQVLGQLAQDLEAAQNLRSKLLGAALYPAIVSVLALAIVVFLLTSVVPQVASVFAGQQRALPTLTVVMLAISQGLQRWGLPLGLGLVLAAVAARWALQQAPLRHRWDAATLRWPVWGPLARAYNSARFAATMAVLSGAGVPILRALETAAHTLPNRALRADALEALGQVREGAPLSLALARQARFSGLLVMFARLGEQTGQLPSLLQRAAEQLGQQVQRRALALATVLEPLLIVLMGAMVMLIVLAVLMPIMEINQWVR